MRPEVRYTQEIRFAIVMYGGVSLAIYINGIAQELLRLVRATAAGPPDEQGVRRALVDSDDLRGTEVVYRRLGQMLAHGEDPGSAGDEEGLPPQDAPIRTRFLVDILSGTSAGGINAIYLAKALANEQSIQELKKLWIEEGDIGRLINDEASVRGVAPLPPDAPPRSLLNGRRMYKKLLDAFRGMDRRPFALRSALADEIDLFVTTTDVHGAPVPLQLADKVIYERRHRNVFHFRYDGTAEDGRGNARRNDFAPAHNALLAFAARSTSAFPFAFEPVTVEQAESVLQLFPGDEGRLSEEALAAAFGGSPVPAAEGERAVDALPYTRRVYADGGYLDNKPFAHAIESLGRRRVACPIVRKLLYVEPAPEELERKGAPTGPPNALQNVGAALIGIPRYESIREDLQRVLARNRLVERVERMTRGTEEDLAHFFGTRPPSPPRTVSTEPDPAEPDPAEPDPAEPDPAKPDPAKPEPAKPDPIPQHTASYAGKDLGLMIDQYGVAYGGYHRLKVAELTDDIARWIARAADLDPGSDLDFAARHMVRAWRDANYSHYTGGKESGASFNRFLMDYDIAYRVRRLRFLRARLDTLAYGGDEAERLLADTKADRVPEAAIRVAAAVLRPELNSILEELLSLSERLESRGELHPLREFVVRTGVSEALMRELLAEPDEASRTHFAVRMLGLGDSEPLEGWTREDVTRVRDGFSEIAGELRDLIEAAAIAAAAAARGLRDFSSDQLPAGERAVRLCLDHFYRRFEAYDLVEYPTLYATEPGDERGRVDVIRISPVDAVALYDPVERGEGKLAGTALGNFGAFLETRWRRHDLIWGRLDGAERLAAALLPGPTLTELRDRITEQAHVAVLTEELRGPDHEAVTGLIAQLAATEGLDRLEDNVRSALFEEGTEPDSSRILELLRSLGDDHALYRYYRDAYQLDRSLDPEAMVRSAARATRVFGRMLEDMGEASGRSGAQGAWIARVGRMMWSLVEVAAPGSAAGLIFRHLAAVLAFFSILLFGVGVALHQPQLRALAVTTFVVVLVLAMAAKLVQDFLRGGRAWRGVVRILAVAAAGALLYFAAAGVAATFEAMPMIMDTPLEEVVLWAVALVLLGTVLANLSALLGGAWRTVVRTARMRPIVGWPLRAAAWPVRGLRAWARKRRAKRVRERSLRSI